MKPNILKSILLLFISVVSFIFAKSIKKGVKPVNQPPVTVITVDDGDYRL